MLTSVWRRAIPGVAAAAVATSSLLPVPLYAQSGGMRAFDFDQPQADFSLTPTFPRSNISAGSHADPFEYKSPSGQPYMKSSEALPRPNCYDIPSPALPKRPPLSQTEQWLGKATTAGTRAGAINDVLKQEFPDVIRMGNKMAKTVNSLSTYTMPIYELAVNRDDQAALGALAGGLVGGPLSVYAAKKGGKLGYEVAGVPGYILGATPGIVYGSKVADKISEATETVLRRDNIHVIPQSIPGFERPIIDITPVIEHPNPQVQAIIDRYSIDAQQAVSAVDRDASVEERALWNGRRLEATLSIMESACDRNLLLEEELKQEIEFHYETICYETTHRPTLEEQLLVAAETNQMPDSYLLPEFETAYNVHLQAFCNR